MESNDIPSYDHPATCETKITLSAQDFTQAQPRNWKNAPNPVRSADTLAILAMAFYGVLTLISLVGTVHDVLRPPATSVPITIILMPVVFGGLTYLNINLIRRHRIGDPSAWRSQIVISAICLLGFPLLTILHLLVLSRWFQPETKAWYGIK